MYVESPAASLNLPLSPTKATQGTSSVQIPIAFNPVLMNIGSVNGIGKDDKVVTFSFLTTEGLDSAPPDSRLRGQTKYK